MDFITPLALNRTLIAVGFFVLSLVVRAAVLSALRQAAKEPREEPPSRYGRPASPER